MESRNGGGETGKWEPEGKEQVTADWGSAAASGPSCTFREREEAGRVRASVLTGLGDFPQVPALLLPSVFSSVRWDLCPESLKRTLQSSSS